MTRGGLSTAHGLLAGAFGVALAAAHSMAPAFADDPFGNKFDHFQCYTIVDFGTLTKAKLKLKDQFRADEAALGRPRFVCNPVDKNGEGIPEEKLHLVCYSIKVAHPDQKTYAVATTNQLEKSKYYVRGPQLLCVPSLKEIVK